MRVVAELHREYKVATNIVIDNLEEISKGNSILVQDLVRPILERPDWVENPYLRFIIFLPLEKKDDLNLDEFQRGRWAAILAERWTPDELMLLLQKRLEHFSGGKRKWLALISDIPDLDKKMCEDANGLPRNSQRGRT